MGDFEKRNGVFINDGDTVPYDDYDQNLLNKDLREPVALEEYIRPFELAGFFDIRFPLSITSNYYINPNTGSSGIRLEFE